MDMLDGIIVGAAAAAIGTIVAMKYLNTRPQGGGEPIQPLNASNPNFGTPNPLTVYDIQPLPGFAAPVMQVSPITEAAYNVQPVDHVPAFGHLVNQPEQEAVLPQ